MTRLSDSLRGLADRAPVGEVGVSTSAATRRIYRGRRLRAAANATAGAGLVAVIALAAIHPGMGSADSSTANAALAPAPAEGGKAAAPIAGGATDARLAWGACGTSPFNAEVPAVSDKFSLALGEIGAEVDQGATIKAALTVTRSADVTSAFTSTGSNYMVLWDGIVVGTAQDSTLDPAVQSLADGTAKLNSQIDLVNCWDGTPLPPGDYKLVAYQDFYPQSTQPVPTIEPSTLPVDPSALPVEPSASQLPVDPTLAPVNPAPLEPTASPDAPIAVDGGAVAGNTGVVGPATGTVVTGAPAERAVSNTVKLVIAGDAPKDPFGAYLSPAAPAVVYPDDYLTPAAARDEYAARATAGTWDMAAGSQRVVKTGDSLTANDQNAWVNSYYGCSADGTSVPSFPSASADWSLLKVDATLPGSVRVSYGWVVDGNPEVKVSVKNISGHTLPGFWGQPNSTMYLVKDGKVVATSYLTPTDPNGNTTTTSSDGLLAPDASLSGDYLWRDVNGCWLGSSQASLKPGTYTVLMEQDVYLNDGSGGSGGPIMYLDGKRPIDGTSTGIEIPNLGAPNTGASGGGTAGSTAIGGPVPAPAVPEARVATPPSAAPDAPTVIAPAPSEGSNDWLSLQVWTSLGKVTVR